MIETTHPVVCVDWVETTHPVVFVALSCVLCLLYLSCLVCVVCCVLRVVCRGPYKCVQQYACMNLIPVRFSLRSLASQQVMLEILNKYMGLK